jgi:hypothetical protein
MKRLSLYFMMILLCATASSSQTRRGAPPAQKSMKPGYYFTIDMCHACYYPNWATDLIRLFQEKGLQATLYEGALMETKNAPFAAIKLFPRRGLWGDIVYIGPFDSEEAALAALEKFPPVLANVQNKRNKLGGKGDPGWPLSENEPVKRDVGNDYKYGFYEIKGCRLLAQ